MKVPHTGDKNHFVLDAPLFSDEESGAAELVNSYFVQIHFQIILTLTVAAADLFEAQPRWRSDGGKTQR